MNLFTKALGSITEARPAEPSEGMRDFLAQSALPAILETTADANEDFVRSEMLLIFDTRSQHTWLLASNAALYCIIDNRRQLHARKLWRLARSDIERDGKIIVQIIEADVTDHDSYLIIGKQRPRKISKHLFETLSVEEVVRNLLTNAFQLQPLTRALA